MVLANLTFRRSTCSLVQYHGTPAARSAPCVRRVCLGCGEGWHSHRGRAMDLQAYLQRINYRGEQTPTAATLRELHRAHLLTVPFENLDIHLGRPILLDQAALFEKIVSRRRGGFCYELNGLFALLLRELGF